MLEKALGLKRRTETRGKDATDFKQAGNVSEAEKIGSVDGRCL